MASFTSECDYKVISLPSPIQYCYLEVDSQRNKSSTFDFSIKIQATLYLDYPFSKTIGNPPPLLVPLCEKS